MTLRTLGSSLSADSDIKASLLKNDAFVYAHLVKIEKAVKTVTGDNSRKASDYAYITDSGFDIDFDDGSTDGSGAANGSRTYFANKLISTGSISETIEARASSISIQLSAAALNTETNIDFTTTSSSIITDVDLVDAGFAEGDKIQLTVTGAGNATTHSGNYYTIKSFTNNNKTAVIDTTLLASASDLTAIATEREGKITFSSEEVIGLLNPKENNTTYAGYINRDVKVYKAHIQPDTGIIIGSPFLLFKGIIASSKIVENPLKSSVITWVINSHWGDFVNVNGRLTSDQHHRALDGGGIPDISALDRKEYADDLGFLHSEQAINLVSIYQAKETRTRLEKKKKLFGLIKKYTNVEYEVEVDREVDLRFNLDAKHLPVVYGVQKLSSFPVFVDTLKTDAKKVYVAYAICEGEIAGLYDIYFDDTSSICVDKNDNEARSTQTSENTIDVLCRGRMDRGDVLGSTPVLDQNNLIEFTPDEEMEAYIDSLGETQQFAQEINLNRIQSTFGINVTNVLTGAGISHEKGHVITTPIDARIVFHAGKRGQVADSLLVSIAQANNFKIQSDYYDKAEEYWGRNHRLLDTAYVVVEYTIGEGETEIPSLDFVVRGKILECYNYDFAYQDDPSQTSADISNFNIGDEVETVYTALDSTILSSVVIEDIYTFKDETGTDTHRVKFKSKPNLSFPNFYMKKGAHKYYLQTYDHVIVSGTVAEKLEADLDSAGAGTTKGIKVTVTSPSGDGQSVADALQDADLASFNFSGSGLFHRLLRQAISRLNLKIQTTDNAGELDNLGSFSSTDFNNSDLGKIVLKDVVKLASGSSSTTDAYVGKILELTKVEEGVPYVQERKIISYNGTTKVAKVNFAFDPGYIPDDTYTYKIKNNGDKRVSINPAMQLLDYISNKRYGRGLSVENDIDLEGFQLAARDCDTTSDITTSISSSTNVVADDVYKYSNSAGKTLWQGTVKNIASKNSLNEVTWKDVIGKLGQKWHDWKTYQIGDIVWYNGSVYEKTVSAGLIPTDFSAGISTVSSLALTKVSGNASSPTSLSLTLGGTTAMTPEGNPIVRKFSESSYLSGYSLYDCDEVKYWKYLGWESQNQRHVTRHQTNAVINTNTSVFDNINSMLAQFNGMLRYSGGLYSLEIAGASPDSLDTVTVDGTVYTPSVIEEEDIIGSINVEDAGQKGTFNTVSVSIKDPQNRYEDRSVTLFNSTYLKDDKNIPKKGDIRTPHITNYFNGRINAKQYLERSRYGLSINFTMAPKGLLLLAGEIIKINYPRFGWVNKEFRISNLNFKKDCLVQVSAEEHHNEAFLLQETNRDATLKGAESGRAPTALPSKPTSLYATDNNRGGISLSWANSANFNAATHSVQIWRNDNANFASQTISAGSFVVGQTYTIETVGDTDFQAIGASADTVGVVFTATGAGSGSGEAASASAHLVGTTKTDTHIDQIIDEGQTTRYYWIRYAVVGNTLGNNTVALKERFSQYEPLSSNNGISGISDGSIDGLSVNLTNDNVSVQCDPDGTNPNFSNTGTTIRAFVGTTPLSNDQDSPHDNSSFRVWTAASGVTPATTNTIGTYTFTKGNITAMPGDTGKITYNIVIKSSIGTETTLQKVQTFTKAKQGSTGVNTAVVYAYRRSSTALSETVKPSTTRTWTFADANFSDSNGATTIDLGNQFESEIPEGEDPLYACTAIASSIATTDDVTSTDWSSPQLIGASGVNTAVVYAYRRSSTVLTTEKPTTSATWTFADANFKNASGTVITALGNDFHSEIPSGTDPLYVCTALASSAESTDSVVTADWSAAQQMSASGENGSNTAVVYAYRRSSTALGTGTSDKPSTSATWTFADANFKNASGTVITALGNDFHSVIPSGTDEIYACTAIATSQAATDSVVAADWTDAQLLVPKGANGLPGEGTNTAVVYAYRRSSTALGTGASDKPSTSATWTFADATFKNASGTVITALGNDFHSVIPSGTDNLYICTAIASSTESTDSVVAADWTSPQVISANGTSGTNSAVVFAYRRSSSALTTEKPDTARTYTFADGTFNNTDLGNSFTSNLPSGTASLYACTAVAASTGTTDEVAVADWSSPQVIAVQGADGADGADGSDGASGITTQNSYPYMGWSSGDNATTWVPSGTLDSTVAFRNGGTVVGDVTIRGTLDTSTGNVSLAEVGGEDTTDDITVTYSGQNSDSASATVALRNSADTATLAEATVIAVALNLGNLGK